VGKKICALLPNGTAAESISTGAFKREWRRKRERENTEFKFVLNEYLNSSKSSCRKNFKRSENMIVLL
jgi:hypothetical protein